MSKVPFFTTPRMSDPPRLAVVLGAMLALAGCPTLPPAFVDEADAPRPERRDGGPPPDAYVMDSGPRPDTGPRPDAFRPRDTGLDTRSDAPVDPITVDGRLSERVWVDAIEYAPTAAGSGLLFGGARFVRFVVFRTETTLSIAYEGDFLETNTIVVYIDRDYGSDLGVLLNGVPLADRAGAVDAVLSNAITTVDTSFRPDIAWGSAKRPESATTSSGTLGWRTLSQFGSHINLSAGRSVCTDRICETSIPLATLGVDAGATLRLAMRVGDSSEPDLWADGLVAPADEAAFISATISIPPPE